MDRSAHVGQHDSVDQQPQAEEQRTRADEIGAWRAPAKHEHDDEGNECRREQERDLRAELAAEQSCDPGCATEHPAPESPCESRILSCQLLHVGGRRGMAATVTRDPIEPVVTEDEIHEVVVRRAREIGP